MSRWGHLLDSDERIIWRGRPAPRAYTFRRWRWSLWTLAHLGPALALCWGGIRLAGAFVADCWWLWVIVAGGLGAAVGPLCWARLEWERIFYFVTDRRLLAVSGIFGQRCRAIPLAELRQVRQRALGEALATVEVAGKGQHLTLYCLEHPRYFCRQLAVLARADSLSADGVAGPGNGV